VYCAHPGDEVPVAIAGDGRLVVRVRQAAVVVMMRREHCRGRRRQQRPQRRVGRGQRDGTAPGATAAAGRLRTTTGPYAMSEFLRELVVHGTPEPSPFDEEGPGSSTQSRRRRASGGWRVCGQHRGVGLQGCHRTSTRGCIRRCGGNCPKQVLPLDYLQRQPCKPTPLCWSSTRGPCTRGTIHLLRPSARADKDGNRIGGHTNWWSHQSASRAPAGPAVAAP